eukprot:6194512-Pleurochrysis_carterae.AAC.1
MNGRFQTTQCTQKHTECMHSVQEIGESSGTPAHTRTGEREQAIVIAPLAKHQYLPCNVDGEHVVIATVYAIATAAYFPALLVPAGRTAILLLERVDQARE